MHQSNLSGCVLRLVTGWLLALRLGVFDRRATETALTAARRTTTFTTRAAEATVTAGSPLTRTSLPAGTAAAHHLAQFVHRGHVLFLGNTSVRISVHAFEGFLGITKHPAASKSRATTFLATRATKAWTPAFRSTRWAATFRSALGTATFGTSRRRIATFRRSRRTTETAFTFRARPAFATRATHAATSLTHALSDLSKLGLIDKTIRIRIGTGEALVRLFARHASELFFADLAIAVGIRPLHEFGQTARPITALWGGLGLTALLGIGKTNAKADEAEANDERCISFHGLIEGEKVELGDGETLRS